MFAIQNKRSGEVWNGRRFVHSDEAHLVWHPRSAYKTLRQLRRRFPRLDLASKYIDD